MISSCVQRVVILLFTGVCLGVPATAVASATISEIMFSPKGADSTYEWVEVHNTGDKNLHLTDWHLRENETNHRISTSSGSAVLAPGGYAVLADKPQKLQGRFPDAAPVFDTAFGLSNDGESLSLINSEDQTIDTVTYSPADQADGTGNSLQKINSTWQAAAPTPAAANQQDDQTGSQPQDDDSTSGDRDGSSSQRKTSVYDPADTSLTRTRDESTQTKGQQPENNPPNQEQTKVTLRAGQSIQTVAGALTHLQGAVQAPESSDVDTDDARWTLGNGDTKQGADIFYTYDHPGTYIATLRLPGREAKPDQVTVRVAPPKLTVADTETGPEGYIQVNNQLDSSVDLSGWHLRANGETFTLPPYTKALANSSLRVANKASGLQPSGSVELLYPDGRVADTYRPGAETNSQSAAGQAAAGSGQSPQQTDGGIGQVAGARQSATGRQSDNATKKGQSGAGTESEEGQSATGTNLQALFATSSSAASAQTGTSNFWNWVGLLAAVVIAGVGTLVVLSQQSIAGDDPDRLADTFDIEEL